MTGRGPQVGRRSPRRRRTRLAALALAGLGALSACGLPGPGHVRTVDAGEVPYRLLEPAGPPAPAQSGSGPVTKSPAVFWVDGDLLRPAATEEACSDDPRLVVEGLLSSLAAGPSEEERADGRSSAVPSDFGLELAGIDGATATVDIEPTASLGAGQLPVAVGQIVLSVTSAPGVVSVVLTSDGEPLQVPLPAGALTEEPVAAQDYDELLPTRLQAPDAVGCAAR